MAEQASLKATVHGLVQGVSFRAFVLHHARNLSLTGYARNLPNGNVEVYGEGGKTALERWLTQLKTGPEMARVDRVDVEWGTFTGGYTDFRITR